MNFNCLKKAYWLQQAARVEGIRQQIVDRMNTAPGRVVPDAPDLTIGTGRRLKMAILFLAPNYSANLLQSKVHLHNRTP